MLREELTLVFVIHYLAEELRDNFDLLSPWQQVGERNPRHSGHLHVINDAHQFLQQAQREVGVFEAVDRQTTARLFITVLWRSERAGIGEKTTKHQHLFFFKPYQLKATWTRSPFYLQISDDGVLHVLFLFLQEVKTDCV